MAAALLLAGCSTAPDDEMVPRPTAVTTVVSHAAAPLPRLPHGASTYRPGEPARVRDGVIEVDGRRIDVAPLRADQAVATRGGTFFLNAGELWYAGSHGARSTGLSQVDRLVLSPDGRRLGLVDRTHGPSGADRTRVAAVVVYDTVTGRPVLRSTAGMGALGEDLHSAYAATPPEVVSLGTTALVARTPSGRYRYPLDGGRPMRLR
ncbi:MAG: hypothetical protein ACTHNS_01845 [Marmoricola sp.]